MKPPQKSNISHSPPREALLSFFLDGFARTATVDPSAVSVTAAHERPPATAPALPAASHEERGLAAYQL